MRKYRQKYRKHFFIGTLILAGFALWWMTKEPAIYEPPRLPERKLEKTYAEFRAQYVSGLHYNFKFDISGVNVYTGLAKMDFQLSRPVNLTVDFFGGEVKSVKVNGENAPVNYNGFYVTIDKANFVRGENTVEIDFQHKYSNTGAGFHRSVDKEDQNAYMYSDFEPYDANSAFPCFDQPDLKATFESTVIAPKGWQVISSTLEESRTPSDTTEEWIFPRSKRFSTYVYSLHAGPFAQWTSEVVTKAHPIPLRLFARQSMAKYVDPEEWFSTTSQGFNFFEEYFDFPYPYGKYDQVIVADFNSGAMENVGAVTFNESRFISRGTKSYPEKRRLAEVILHEMAHMWFGDLVTMKWWNDIWLNESFATYIATRALVAATPYTDSWEDFSAGEKQWAYHEDQLVTTHPIEFTVPDTEVVFANFDGITYGKGASVLKQLSFYVEDKFFKKGLQDYFKLYAYYNTTLGEFMNEITQASRRNLDFWQKSWLQLEGVTTLKVDYTCSEGQLSNVQLVPSAYPSQHFRDHRTKVAILNLKEGKWTQAAPPVDQYYSSSPVPLAEFDGLDCEAPMVIYPNFEDHNYVRVELDEKTKESVFKHLSSIEDNLLRIGLWTSLWDMVLDGKITAVEYANVFMKHSLREKSLDAIRITADKMSLIANWYLPQDEAHAERRNKLVSEIAAHFLKAAKSASSEDLQRLWFEKYLAVAEQSKDLKVLSDLLTARKKTWLRYELDQDERWEIIGVLNRRGFGDYKKFLEAERAKDNTDRGEKTAAGVEASQPDDKVKELYWHRLAQGPSSDFSMGQIRPIILNLFPVNQESYRLERGPEFFKTLDSLSQKPGEFLTIFATLAPAGCATDSVKTLKEAITKNPEWPPTVLKRLKMQAHEAERCVAIRENVVKTWSEKTAGATAKAQ